VFGLTFNDYAFFVLLEFVEKRRSNSKRECFCPLEVVTGLSFIISRKSWSGKRLSLSGE